MNEAWIALVCVGAGVVLGTASFAGLYWTTRHALSLEVAPHWWMLSRIVRVGLLLSAYALIAGNHAERFLYCMLGTAIARVLAGRWFARREGGAHAPQP